MSIAMKISLLALLGSAVAHPSYGVHSKFHAKAAGTAKPYPVGGWSGNYNSTRVAYPTASGSDDKTTTIDTTTTSTTTLYTTIYATPEAITSVGIKEVPTGVAGSCGPATVTVTASEKVTVTVTPGGGADAPKSSAALVKSSAGGEYPAAPAPTPVAEKPTAAAEKPSSSKVEAVTSKPAEYAAYPVPSVTEKSSVAYSSAAPVVPTSAAPASSAAASSAVPSSSAAPKPSGAPSYAGTKRGLANVDKAVKAGSTAVMGFNEPDHTAQANLSPEAACSAWKEYLNPIASSHPEVTIIGPSVTNGPAGSKMGLEWLSSFNEACPDAVVHATNIHFYDIHDDGTLERFKAHVEKATALANKPVWVTEFGLNPGSATPEQAAKFLEDCMAYLDGNNNVQGYSWFMVGKGENQLNTDSGLSKLGQIYATGL